MKRHLDNLEGAFPLLLIGSVLLVYAGLLAGQEIGSKSSHLPLWGLLGGVGAVIVGAGIYSTFLEPATLPSPKVGEQWVTVPRREWEELSPYRQPVREVVSQDRGHPIWWEGPPESPSEPRTRLGLDEIEETKRPTLSRIRAAARRTPSPSQSGRPFSTGTRYSLKELRNQLTELEALVYGDSTFAAGGRSGAKGALAGGVTTCMDCERRFPPVGPSGRCRGCGRGLCASCVASSRAEDGKVRCVDCRAREP